MRMFFGRMNLDEAFEFLLNRKIIASEFKQASKLINRLKGNDWRLWFGRFLLAVRSDADANRFTAAYLCLLEAEALISEAKNAKEKEKFLSMINNESLFLEFKFCYEATGVASVGLLIARAYYSGWGVKQNIPKAYEIAEKVVNSNTNDAIRSGAKELLALISSQTQQK